MHTHHNHINDTKTYFQIWKSIYAWTHLYHVNISQHKIQLHVKHIKTLGWTDFSIFKIIFTMQMKDDTSKVFTLYHIHTQKIYYALFIAILKISLMLYINWNFNTVTLNGHTKTKHCIVSGNHNFESCFLIQ